MADAEPAIDANADPVVTSSSLPADITYIFDELPPEIRRSPFWSPVQTSNQNADGLILRCPRFVFYLEHQHSVALSHFRQIEIRLPQPDPNQITALDRQPKGRESGLERILQRFLPLIVGNPARYGGKRFISRSLIQYSNNTVAYEFAADDHYAIQYPSILIRAAASQDPQPNWKIKSDSRKEACRVGAEPAQSHSSARPITSYYVHTVDTELNLGAQSVREVNYSLHT